jgi:nucleoside-diphosphate-sugar epimerase
MPTIFVTGVAGFIGSNLVLRLLQEGHSVIGVDNFDTFYDKALKVKNLASFMKHEKFQFIDADLSEEHTYKSFPSQIDAVVHLAAKAGVLPSLKNPSSYIQNNILGTNLLLEWMRSIECSKLVFASSSSVYGNNKTIPFSETDAVNEPISPYAFTKRACELMNYNYHHLYHFDIINLRFFTVYGPAQRPDLAINKFFNLIKTGKPIEMYGDGSTARDYTFVEDTVSGIIGALHYVFANEKVYEIVNLGNHTPVSLKTLIETIYEIQQTPPNIVQRPMQPGDVDITFANIEKAKKLFNYYPSTALKEGLIKFKEWHDEQ